MKKIFIALLMIMAIFTLTACGNNSGINESERIVIPSTENSTDNTAETTKSAEPNEESEEKAVVVYFSCTGNTKVVAEEIARQTGADLYEIIPEQPYTSDDLNYSNDDCRANREMHDDNVRPAISGKLDNIELYNKVYIGYPIWWGTMPRIINTFLDEYDLSGKTIIPFCTSGGSGIEDSVNRIKNAEPNADVKNGLQISAASVENCEDYISSWLNEN